MNILLICGHGAGDPGAIGNGYNEADLVREAAPKLKDILSNYADVTLFDTNKNMYTYLKAGNSFNFKNYNYVLEWHFNAFNKKATGTEIFVHPLEKGVSVEELIVNNISKLGFVNRGVNNRRTDLQNMNICKKKQGVSYALLETCFIDNANDMTLYQSKKNEVIQSIADGIVQGFGLEKKANQLLTSADDITNELNKSFFPITEPKKFIIELEEAKHNNSSLYWGYYKLVNKIK